MPANHISVANSSWLIGRHLEAEMKKTTLLNPMHCPSSMIVQKVWCSIFLFIFLFTAKLKTTAVKIKTNVSPQN